MKKIIIGLLILLPIIAFCFCLYRKPVFVNNKEYHTRDINEIITDQKNIEYEKLNLSEKDLDQFLSYDIQTSKIPTDFIGILNELINNREYLIKITPKFDYEKMSKYLKKRNEEAIKCTDAYIEREDNKFVIKEAEEGNEVDIKSFINAFKSDTSIKLSDYYYTPMPASELDDEFDKINKYLNWKIEYSNGYCLQIPAENINYDNGKVTVDESFIDDALLSIEESYNTSNKPISFNTTSGNTIDVTTKTWGNDIDTQKERDEIKTLFDSLKSQTDRIPIYKNDIVRDQIGDSYVEVDKEHQHVYVYLNGERVYDTDCVSGCVETKHETSEGVFYVAYKQKDKYLVGPTWKSFVHYWIKFTPDSQGLHDASWRSKFGGKIYKTDGSHGCVNLPTSAAKDIYELVYEGMPVIVF